MIQNLTCLLLQSNEKMKHLKNKCHELETRKDQWRDKFGKCNRNVNVAMQYLLCKHYLNQDTHEEQMMEICHTWTQNLHTLRNVKAEMKWRDMMIKRVQAELECWIEKSRKRARESTWTNSSQPDPLKQSRLLPFVQWLSPEVLRLSWFFRKRMVKWKWSCGWYATADGWCLKLQRELWNGWFIPDVVYTCPKFSS